jgi:hypothetical protein
VSPRRERDGGDTPQRPSAGGPNAPKTPKAADPRKARPGDEVRVRGMDRIGDLLPQAAREFGLEEQLEQARLAAAWLRILDDRVPAAAGSSRLIALRQDVATVEADLPIVAQEIRLRTPELLAALRNASHVSVRQLRVVTRHV